MRAALMLVAVLALAGCAGPPAAPERPLSSTLVALATTGVSAPGLRPLDHADAPPTRSIHASFDLVLLEAPASPPLRNCVLVESLGETMIHHAQARVSARQTLFVGPVEIRYDAAATSANVAGRLPLALEAPASSATLQHAARVLVQAPEGVLLGAVRLDLRLEISGDEPSLRVVGCRVGG